MLQKGFSDPRVIARAEDLQETDYHRRIRRCAGPPRQSSLHGKHGSFQGLGKEHGTVGKRRAEGLCVQ